jgi:hypothetical protein
VTFLEDAVEQGSLSGAQEAGQNGDRDAGVVSHYFRRKPV